MEVNHEDFDWPRFLSITFQAIFSSEYRTNNLRLPILSALEVSHEDFDWPRFLSITFQAIFSSEYRTNNLRLPILSALTSCEHVGHKVITAVVAVISRKLQKLSRWQPIRAYCKHLPCGFKHPSLTKFHIEAILFSLNYGQVSREIGKLLVFSERQTKVNILIRCIWSDQCRHL